jgi:hypothetical protein
MRNRSILIAAAALAGLVAAPAAAGETKDIVKGAVVGGLGGAAVGAIVPGVSVGKGAVIGAGGGAVVGALKKNHKYYRDNQGRRYWLDSKGRRRY